MYVSDSRTIRFINQGVFDFATIVSVPLLASSTMVALFRGMAPWTFLHRMFIAGGETGTPIALGLAALCGLVVLICRLFRARVLSGWLSVRLVAHHLAGFSLAAAAVHDASVQASWLQALSWFAFTAGGVAVLALITQHRGAPRGTPVLMLVAAGGPSARAKYLNMRNAPRGSVLH